MHYRAILVDDECLMRESFGTLIPWNKLGFEFCAAFSDGSEAIEYISQNPVDLIVTDVKMPIVSGIELAKYVHDKALDIHIIILSGYEDFGYARSAIDYNVNHYLLKTMSLEEISEHILQVKKELDQTRNAQQHNEDLMLTVKNQFFLDLFFGAITTKDELIHRLLLIKIDSDIADYPCSVLDIEIKNYNEFFKEWNFGKIGFYSALENIFHDMNGYYCYMLNSDSEKIKVFVSSFNKNRLKKPDCFSDIYKIIENNFKNALNLEISIKTEVNYSSLFDILDLKNRIYNSTSDETEDISITQQLLLTHASAGNILESKNLFSALIDRLDSNDLLSVKLTVTTLFLTLIDYLKKYNIDLSGIPDFSFTAIAAFSDALEIKVWGNGILQYICTQIHNHFTDYNKSIILKALAYIKAHCCEDISLGDVANAVYLNSDYLSRLLKKNTNENFIDILTNERIESSMKLLENENLKIYEISQMVGYKTTKYFTKLFKLHTGLTPTEYRNKR